MEKESKYVIGGIIIFFVFMVFISIFNITTAGSGDTVLHFLFSKYSFKHPEFFLHHWAKPVFVLLSAPFSQFGFTGMKIFNSIVACLTAFFTYKTAKKLNINPAYLGIVFLFSAPLYFVLIFSGLTEPLFALILIISIFYITTRKDLLAIILVSFLPFVRSEGLIIICVFFIYLFIRKKFKMIPVLITGHLVYSFIGFFHYKDFFWVFNKIPYANLGSPYGSGSLFDFFDKITYVIGIPLYLFFAIGFIFIILTFIYSRFRNNKNLYYEEIFLVYGCFVAFFVAHSIFWWLGIFNSMGLKRVLLGVMPLIAIISLNGFNLLTNSNLIKNIKANNIIKILFILYIVVFPFTGNNAGFHWDRDFTLTKSQILINKISRIIKEDYDDYTIYYDDPYFGLSLNIDHFDPRRHQELFTLFNGNKISEKALIIWDEWYSVMQSEITLDRLMNNKRFEIIKIYETKEKNRTIKFVLFKHKSNQ